MPFPGASPFDDPNIISPFDDASGEDWLRNNIPPEWAGAPPADALQPGLAIPTTAIDQAAAAPPENPNATPDEAKQFYADMAAAGQPLQSMPGDELEQPTPDPGPQPLGFFAPQAQDALELATLPPEPGGGIVYPEPKGVELTDEQRARQFAAQSPEEQAKQEYLFQKRQQDEENARRSRVALEDQQRSVENHSALVKAQAAAREATVKLDEDAKRIAETEIDTHLEAGVSGIAAAFIGGLVQSRQGGANQGLAMLDKLVERKIDAQKTQMANQRAELQRRGASIQQLAAMDAAAFDEAERYRISAYTAAQNRVSAEMAAFDPRGKSAVELGKLYAQIGSARAKALVDFEDRTFKQQMEAMKFASDQEKAAAELAKTRAETTKLGAETAKLKGALGGGSGAKGAHELPHPPEYFEAMDLPRPPVAMSPAAYEKWLKLKKAGGEAVTGTSKYSKEELERGVADLKTEDGKVFIAQGTPEAVNKLRDQVAATRSLVQLMDEALQIRTGWTSDTAKSEEWQKLKANWAAAIGVAKDALQLGALSGPDMELVEQFLGAEDPTRFIGIESGVKKARENIITMTRNKLNGASGNGKVAFDIKYIEPRPPKPTASDEAQKKALSKPNASEVIEGAADSKNAVIPDLVKGKAPAVKSVDQVAGEFEKNSRAHVEQLDAVLASKESKPEERAKAQALLNELVQSATPAVADLARAVLARQQLDAGDTGRAERKTGVAYDEVPPRPPLEPNKKKGAKKR